MEIISSVKNRRRRFAFRGLSIQQRLPLLIFVLLLFLIVIFSWISWVGVRRAAVKAADERLVAVVNQLSSMFGQSAQTTVAATQATAKEEAVKKFLLSGGKEQREEAMELMRKLGQDRASLMVALLDSNRNRVLYTTKDSLLQVSSFDALLAPGIDTVRVGRIYFVNDSLYYPVVVPVIHDKRTVGYLVRWRIQYSPPRVIEQFSQLLGTDASLYIANTDGSLWTDLVKTIEKPPVDLQSANRFFKYKNGHNKRVMAAVSKIPGTRWAVLVEFSEKKIMESSAAFLKWVILSGAVLIIIGLVITWVISRNITRPLKKLTAAASAISSGDYSLPVETGRTDELGKLARSFNTMSDQVHRSQQELENKVQERTAQLETLNKELEAFSYSISHDLRAPLRIIDGYAGILQTDYKDKMDEEGGRVIKVIKANAQRMGQLIDDLLDFAQISRKEMLLHTPDMTAMVRAVLEELLPGGNQGITAKLNNLETTECDSSLLRQVWINVIGNAIKYSGKKKQPEIEISSIRKEREIIYTVRDNGVGFDMKYAGKLFGVFQRLHKITEFEGTGIGLALASRILARHGGKIWAESEKGNGSTFYFSLPAGAGLPVSDVLESN